MTKKKTLLRLIVLGSLLSLGLVLLRLYDVFIQNPPNQDYEIIHISACCNTESIDAKILPVEKSEQLADKNLQENVDRVNYEQLKKDIEVILSEDIEKYGVVFIDLSNFKSIEINPDLIRTPGSVSKIPYAILTLKMVEQNKLQLDSNLQINPIDKAYPSDELWSRANGSQIPIKELLEYLIIESDNTAMTILENNFGGLNETNRQFEALGINGITRIPHQTTAKNVANMMKDIYNGEFLESQNNDYLISLLGRTNPKYHDRIVAGLPENTKFAHKIGQIFTDGGGQSYNDAAIVFGEKSDYILVILNENMQVDEASKKATDISKLVYEYF